MLAALGLARRGLGQVWPNPTVGCVLVQGDRVVGRGRTGPGGRPHAETAALLQAGDAAVGATAYISLEPCCHHGKTGPCVEALINAGVRRAVVAAKDPDPRVSGKGLQILSNHGIEVTYGILEQEASELNAGFFHRIHLGRPLVTLKIASSLDGRIATHRGESQWITGPEARAVGHRLRAEADAIMVGTGTVLQDNPELTCRLHGQEHRSPIRLVVDGRLRIPLTSKLVASARETPTWVITGLGGDADRRNALKQCHVEVLEVKRSKEEKVDLSAAFLELGRLGLTCVLVEGGAHLTAELLRAGLVDRLVCFRAPLLLGGDAVPAAVSFGVDRLADSPRFIRLGLDEAGKDIVEYFARA